MSSLATLLLSGMLACTTATRSVSHLRHGGKMNPEAVAHTLVAVEGKWVTEAVAYAQCNATDTTCQEDVLGEFKKSCQTVVQAIIQSSNGDKSVVSEYLGDICQQPDLHDWKQNFCNNFAGALNKVLTDDSYVNRDDLPVDNICANFLTRGFLKEAAKAEVARVEEEKQKEIAAQKAEAKREAEEKAAAEAKEAEEAAAKAKAEKAYEEQTAKMRAEMKAKADEARAKAAEETNAEEAVANSSAFAPGATAVNATVNASNVNVSKDSTAANSSVTDSTGANATTTSTAPVQAETEVAANETAVPLAANTTATAPEKDTK